MAELFLGLDALRAAYNDEERYHREMAQMMEDEDNDGVRPPRPVSVASATLAVQYPAAAAYLLAEAYTLAANYAKAGAGDRAIKRLETGEDHKVVLA